MSIPGASRLPSLLLGLSLLSLSVAGAGQTAEEEKLELRELPPEPDAETAPQDSEPQVTIIRRREAVIEEYRVNGIIRAVRITPAYGKPYFLVDTDGDGRFDVHRYSMSDDIRIPSWVVYSWD